MKAIKKSLVIGGGSSGCLAALSLKTKFPQMSVVMVKSPHIPIIGVGESTTPTLPNFLHHYLNLPIGEFLKEVKPSWKLGIRFDWGPKDRDFFYYTFDYQYDVKIDGIRRDQGFHALAAETIEDLSVKASLGKINRSPFLLNRNTGHYTYYGSNGYHIENHTFVAYLEKKCREAGVQIVDATIQQFVLDEQGDVVEAWVDNGPPLGADFFVDCSGFNSLLPNKYGVPFKSYKDVLLCDRAVVGGWSRDEAVRSCTGADTMDSGWMFRVELRDKINCGYVYSSEFISDEKAAEEYRIKTEDRASSVRVVPFVSGRYEKSWLKNVVAIGNSSGFVEPLEATALHVICHQLGFLNDALMATALRPTETVKHQWNDYFGKVWDEIRDFLAIHYRFNQKKDTKFWEHCRANINLGAAQDVYDYFVDSGPSTFCKFNLIPPWSYFGLEGYYAMFMGMGVQSRKDPVDPEDHQRWQNFVRNNSRIAANALSMENSFELTSSPLWDWTGIRIDRRPNPALF